MTDHRSLDITHSPCVSHRSPYSSILADAHNTQSMRDFDPRKYHIIQSLLCGPH